MVTKMNIASKLGLYEKAMPEHLSWPEKLVAARQAGFDFLEISIDETEARLSRLDWRADQRRSLAVQMAEAGMHIETMCLSGHRRYPLGSPDAEMRKKSLRIMAKAIDLATSLGIRIIQLAGYDTFYDPSSNMTRQWFVEGLARSVEIASREGVILGFETMETPFMNTVEKSMAFVSQIDSPYLQIYPDIGNLTNAALEYGKQVEQDILTGSGHLVAVHLKETNRGKYREIPFGTGHTDFARLIPFLENLGIRRYTAEFWHTGQEDWPGELMRAAGYLRPCFSESADNLL